MENSPPHRQLKASHSRATFDYEILETYEAGLVLKGTEIKSIRSNSCSIQEAWIRIDDKGEAWLMQATIPPYRFGSYENHLDTRPRKLLLHRHEIRALRKGCEQKGLTLIALSLHLLNGKAKIRLGLARGKKSHDKREAIKERDVKREMSRVMKSI